MEQRGTVVSFNGDVTIEKMEETFLLKEEEMGAWQKRVWLSILGEEGLNFEEVASGEDIDIFNNLLSLYFAEFTCSPREDNLLKNHLELIKAVGGDRLLDVVERDDLIMFITKDGTITGLMLSKFNPVFKEWFTDIETVRRYGECHRRCIISSLRILDNHNVVTGYVAPFSKKCKNLHTWLEIEDKKTGKYVVYDPSKNLVMNKRGYYLLNKIENVFKIEGQTLKEDIKKVDFLKQKHWLYTKLYLANREEALREYDKFSSENGGEK